MPGEAARFCVVHNPESLICLLFVVPCVGSLGYRPSVTPTRSELWEALSLREEVQ